MSDTPQKSSTTQLSHLTNYMDEVMAALRVRSMEVLVCELIRAFAEENYRFEEFLYALTIHTESMPGWEEVTRHLELASAEISRIRRESAEQTR
jgi:hypothetical protein